MLGKWLQEQDDFPKVLFSDEKGAIAGSGIADKRGDLIFSAQDFFPFARKTDLWEKFPSSISFSPKHLCQGELEKKNHPFSLPERIIHSPAFPKYDRILQKLLSDGLQKAVFARQTTFTYKENLDPYLYLNHFAGKGKLFFYQVDPETTFLGATPESLFQREGKKITTAAIAGTRPLGKGKELLQSLKDLSEFGFVQEEIAQTLSEFCETVEFEKKPGLLQTPNLEHLYTIFQGRLKTIDDQVLISALHPTPATCGVPKEKALRRLYECESFDRGWYAAPIGFSTKKRAHFFVAIRSALIVRNQLHLFAGSGIVSNSKSNDEWNELNNKIKLWTM
ncbi:MAG: hypothetical protein ChlgKO_14320 [Chlamydiales bacterium]